MRCSTLGAMKWSVQGWRSVFNFAVVLKSLGESMRGAVLWCCPYARYPVVVTQDGAGSVGP
jgi:hypothetical protein